MRKKIVNKEHGQRMYVEKKYSSLDKNTETEMNRKYLYKNSEFKKPYLSNNYPEMEHFWPATRWNPSDFNFSPDPVDFDFDMPGGFPETMLRGVSIFGCKDEGIKYETLSMTEGETQEVNLTNGQSFHEYLWDAEGGGADVFNLKTAFVTTDGQGLARTNVFDSTGTNGEVVIQLISRDTEKVCAEITVKVKGCNGETIGYTTLEMLDNETQTLTVTDPVAGYSYVWTVTGNGELDIYTGESVVFDPGAGGNHQVIISLYTNGLLCDFITIVVLCSGGSWVETDSYYKCDSGYAPLSGANCEVYIYTFTTPDKYSKKRVYIQYGCICPFAGCSIGACTVETWCTAADCWADPVSELWTFWDWVC